MNDKEEKAIPKVLDRRYIDIDWFCAICSKQCRDEDDYIYHALSDSHKEKRLLNSDNENKLNTEDRSKEFAQKYLELLRGEGTNWVKAYILCQDIKNRDHIHVSNTRWKTLIEFVNWLGREGMCRVHNTGKDLLVAYIQKNPAISAQKAKAIEENADKDGQDKREESLLREKEFPQKDSRTVPRAEQRPLSDLRPSSSNVAISITKPAKVASTSKMNSKDDNNKKHKWPGSIEESSKKQKTEESRRWQYDDTVTKLDEGAAEKANSSLINRETKSSRATYLQYEGLADFLNENPEIARGPPRTILKKYETKLKWDAQATLLNALSEDPKDVKDGTAWAKVWADKKRFLRKTLSRAGGKHDDILPYLNPVDRRLMAFLSVPHDPGAEPVQADFTRSTSLLESAETIQEFDLTSSPEGVSSPEPEETDRVLAASSSSSPLKSPTQNVNTASSEVERALMGVEVQLDVNDIKAEVPWEDQALEERPFEYSNSTEALVASLENLAQAIRMSGQTIADALNQVAAELSQK